MRTMLKIALSLPFLALSWFFATLLKTEATTYYRILGGVMIYTCLAAVVGVWWAFSKKILGD